MPINLIKLTTKEKNTVRGDDQNDNFSSFPLNRESESLYPSGNIRQQFEENSQYRAPLYSEHYEREIPHKRKPFFSFDAHSNNNQHCFNNQIDTFRAQRFSKKLRLDIVRNPRDTINYFEEELYDEGAFNDDEKYNYLIGF